MYLNSFTLIGEAWYDDQLSSEIASKSLKTGITSTFDRGENKLFIGYSKCLEMIIEMVVEVKQ